MSLRNLAIYQWTLGKPNVYRGHFNLPPKRRQQYQYAVMATHNSTRYVDGTPTSEVTPFTIRYIRPPHHGHTINSQYHGHEWMTHILFVPCQSAAPFLGSRAWDIAISDPNLETPRSRSWVWSRGNVIQSAQYHINSLPFHFTTIRPTIPEIELFRNLILKHPRLRSWVRSKVKITYYTQYRTDALPFRFTSIGPTIPKIWPK